MAATGVPGAFLNGPGRFVHWGVIQISVGNLVVIALMLVVFALAVAVPFGHAMRGPWPVPVAAPTVAPDPTPAGEQSWTSRVRGGISRLVPAGQALPDRQPAYVSSWIYVFGVLSLAALVVVIATGCVLAVEGDAWWHVSGIGHFANSLHLWSVELFFFFMVIHLWGKFFMAAWRGGRALTWVTGVVAFAGSVGAAFTGYLVQTNFDSQWISTQAKDGLNSVGIGAFFNVLNTGQMLLWHVILLPIVLGIIVVAHVVLVRRHGVVPPIGVESPTGTILPASVEPPTGHVVPAPAPALKTGTAGGRP